MGWIEEGCGGRGSRYNKDWSSWGMDEGGYSAIGYTDTLFFRVRFLYHSGYAPQYMLSPRVPSHPEYRQVYSLVVRHVIRKASSPLQIRQKSLPVYCCEGHGGVQLSKANFIAKTLVAEMCCRWKDEDANMESLYRQRSCRQVVHAVVYPGSAVRCRGVGTPSESLIHSLSESC